MKFILHSVNRLHKGLVFTAGTNVSVSLVGFDLILVSQFELNVLFAGEFESVRRAANISSSSFTVVSGDVFTIKWLLKMV